MLKCEADRVAQELADVGVVPGRSTVTVSRVFGMCSSKPAEGTFDETATGTLVVGGMDHATKTLGRVGAEFDQLEVTYGEPLSALTSRSPRGVKPTDRSV